MNRLFASACLALAACGTTPTPAAPAIDKLFPAANEVGTWAEDTTVGKAGVEVAKSGTAIESLINGDGAPFIEKGALALGWEHYLAGASKLDARVFQMKTAANAQETWDHLVANVSLYKANTWTTVTATGDAARVADTGSSWWFNARKGAFIVELKITPKDATTRTEVETFAKAMVGKVP
jgi:hypothetical protein